MEFLSLLTITPDVENYQLVNTPIDKLDENLTNTFFNVKKTYYYTELVNDNNINLLNLKLRLLLYNSDEDINISPNVYQQSIDFIDVLYPSILEHVEYAEIYSTHYGTVVFDWEKDADNIFSLEIGANTIGYFIEENGVDSKQIDSLPLQEIRQELLHDLSEFLN